MAQVRIQIPPVVGTGQPIGDTRGVVVHTNLDVSFACVTEAYDSVDADADADADLIIGRQCHFRNFLAIDISAVLGTVVGDDPLTSAPAIFIVRHSKTGRSTRRA